MSNIVGTTIMFSIVSTILFSIVSTILFSNDEATKLSMVFGNMELLY